MQVKHLRQAQQAGIGVLDFGDFFCAMQGRYDKRSNKSMLRSEHQVDDYLDSLISTATDFFDPYSKNIIMIAHGNHETGIMKNHETDLIKRLCKSFSNPVFPMGYSGWVQFAFKSKGKTEIKKLWFIHGYGGGGPVTKGTIQTNRRAAYLNADIVVTGHIHESWTLDIPRLECTNDGRVIHKEQVHVQIPTYKDEYSDGHGGWHIETGKPPKPVGATWLVFSKEDADAPIVVDTRKAR
jgi:predicted phosphodiesterase